MMVESPLDIAMPGFYKVEKIHPVKGKMVSYYEEAPLEQKYWEAQAHIDWQYNCIADYELRLI